MYNKVSFITLLTLLLVIINALSVHGDSPVFNRYPKCKITLTSQRIMELCYKEMTGKDVDPATITIEDVSEKEREDTMYCAFKKNGIIGLDGKTVNIRKADNNIDTMETEQSMKDKMKAEAQVCADKGGEGIDYVRCNIASIASLCKD